jgi:hypothetical protein
VTYIRLVHPYYLRFEGFQTDYLGSILHIEEHICEFDIQRRRKDLVIDQLHRQSGSPIQIVTYNNISFLESLGDIFRSPEITFMRLNIGIAIQTPHCPTLFGFLKLESSTMGGNW